MPQGRWERAFWAAARSGDFKPYPPEHWYKKKVKKKKSNKIGRKSSKKASTSKTLKKGEQLGFLL